MTLRVVDVVLAAQQFVVVDVIGGVQIVGRAGGSGRNTSIAEPEVPSRT